MKESFELGIQFNQQEVLLAAECKMEDPKYSQYQDLLAFLIEEYIDLIKPIGYVLQLRGTKELPFVGCDALICLVTLGQDIDKIIKEKFEKFEYLQGVLLSCLADQILFEASGELRKILDSYRNEIGYLSVRYEPGSPQVPMEYQKEIYDELNQAFSLDMSLSDGFMLTYAKSLIYYYGISQEDCSNGLDHDCSLCQVEKCPSRKYLIRVQEKHKTTLIQAKRGENLLNVLRSQGYFVNAPCNGKGLCGKCSVLIDGQNLLSCMYTIDKSISVNLDAHHNDEEVVESDFLDFDISHKKTNFNNNYGLAIDIGTTTIVVALIHLETGNVVKIEKGLNPQKAYGADVISRIMHVEKEGGDRLQKILVEAIEKMIKGFQIEASKIGHIVISGNTTMVYLLLKMDPQALAIAPFVTEDLAIIKENGKELFNSLDADISIMPYISAYVGGDITSGIYACDLMESDRVSLLVDIGTNGEMVLKWKEGLLSAATAAGPAFEGANISCGMGAVSGAICEIKADGDGYSFNILGGLSKAKGICGSALIDSIALLHQKGFIDDSGYMEKEVMFKEDIGIYPKDVRQVQLAKAAIKAGIDVLLEKAGLSYDEVDDLLIAGGFGRHINIDNSAYIGLFPKDLKDKVKLVGNSSLGGAIKFLLDDKGEDALEAITKRTDYMELSSNLDFNNAYIMGMSFGS